MILVPRTREYTGLEVGLPQQKGGWSASQNINKLVPVSTPLALCGFCRALTRTLQPIA